MESILTSNSQTTKPFSTKSKINRIVYGILIVSSLLGVVTGYTLSKKASSSGVMSALPIQQAPKNAVQDTRTFKDFAEGTVKARPASKNPNEYVEGSHLLVRDGAYPVAVTSSVVDLSKYEGKKVKVFGETQKALKEGWLMDVGRVEEVQ